ncbi:hypothetical protein [Mycolicibacterium llatzerense]|uniref:hypothetical protein n=1 Tax=Mycolicibacterium llatzerense TaxID=280871 RepID=UPI0008DE64E7|nr:hypothetical protein [Mycolicibacterium llatzerense]
MDTARIEGTDPPVQVAAQELRAWEPDQVAASAFCCIGCGERLIPKAFGLNKKVQAYFSLHQHRQHESGCPVGATARAGGTDDDAVAAGVTAVGHWPTRLIAAPSERTTATSSGDLRAAGGRRPGTGAVGGGGARGRGAPSPARAYSIGAFAHAFLRMDVEQRKQALISLPGVDADRYQYAFKRLPQWSIERLTFPRRVFYGQLRWTARIEDTGAEYRLALHAGEWDDEAKRFQRHWELRVDHSDWTTRGRAAFRDELESAINQARDQDKQPWFFTLATQHPDLPSVIETRDRRHVAFLPLDAARAPT